MKKTMILTLISLFLVGVGKTYVRAEADKSSIAPLIIKEETFLGADFSQGIYTYQLDRKFNEIPNTISSWIRLGKLNYGQPGGVIFGNSEYDNTSSISLEINKDRNVILEWNQSEIVIIFDKYKVPEDEWTYITVMRDELKREFILYVNGILVQKVNNNPGQNKISDYKFVVGGDWANTNEDKNIFKGEIGQVTVYNRILNSREVYLDFMAENNINSSNREGLMFNSEFTLGCKETFDTSNNDYKTFVRSNDYFFDGEIYEAKDYSIAVIPDPQVMVHWLQGNLPSISEYIIEKHQTHNVAMSICVGDNADGYYASHPQYDMDYQLSAIKNEYDKWYDAGIRWATTPGNHDYDNNAPSSRSLVDYNRYFTQEELETFDYFGGIYKEGQTQNAYYTFEECGINYLVVSIEFAADDNVLKWANEVVADYPDHRVIVFTHAYVGGSGELPGNDSIGYSFASNACNDPIEIYDKFIKKHKNMFMVISGHYPSDDVLLKESIGEHGNTIMQFLVDAQGIMMAGCESLVSMLTFDELNQKIYVNYESTTTRELFNIQNQYEVSFKGYTNILSSIYYDKDGNLKDEYI